MYRCYSFIDEQYLDFRGMSFRQFMNEGRGEHVANLGISHFIYHVISDVRLKQFLEVRAADMGNRDYVLGCPHYTWPFMMIALWNKPWIY